MKQALATIHTTPPDVVEDQPSRQLVALSHAFRLLSNGEPREEIKEAISPDLARAIDLALVGVRNELATAVTKDQRAEVIVELGRYMGIAGGGWPEEQRAEWMNCAEQEFLEFPLQLVLTGIARARRRVRYPGEFVPWVLKDIEEAVESLRREEALVAELREIARS